MHLEGKMVVVVGGNSGIGLAVAVAAHAAGAAVVIMGRSVEKLARATAAIGPNATALTVDVTSEASAAEAFAAVPAFDHLFLSAQDAATAPLADTTAEALRPTLDSKIWGAVHVVKQAAGRLRPGGSITFISGLAARKGYPGFVVAAAANAGIEAVARTLAVELAPVRVNTVCAGVIDTDMLDRVFGDKRAEIVASVAAKLPVKRIGRPEEVADAVLFLMGNEFVTGITLLVDGGDALA